MKFLGVSILFFQIIQIFGQNSFIKTIDYEFEVPNYSFEGDMNNEVTFLDMIGFSGPNEHFKIVNLSTQGEVISGYSIKIDSVNLTFGYKFFDRKGDINLVSFGPFSNGQNLTPGIFCFDLNLNTYWSKKIAFIDFGSPLPSMIAKKSKMVLSQIFTKDTQLNGLKSGVAAFDLYTGNSIWSYSFLEATSKEIGFAIEEIAEYPDGKIALTFFTVDENLNGRQGLAIMSNSGEILNNIVIDKNHDSIQFLLEQNIGIDDNSNSYILGVNRTLLVNNQYDRKPFIAKFDSNLDLVWAKRLFAENFPYEGLKHRVLPNGDVIFVYNTDGDLPVIVGKLDTDGNLLWHRGYSFYNPEVQIGSDGSIYFLSPRRYFPDGTSEEATLFAKADPNGDIESCPQFDACLTLFDMDIPYTRWDWIREPADTFGSYTATITPFTTSTEDYCGTPAPPNPYFTLPDTICQGTILRPDSLYNFLAHAVEWTITGQNTNIAVNDTAWQYNFTEPGTYQIEQEIWLLGCSEFFTRNLTVLPDSLGNLLGEDQLICEGDTLVLSPSAVRPLKSFEWQDGSTDSAISVSNSGVYSVKVSDGFCSARDQITLTAFEEKYPEQIIELPNDSSICEDFLPIVLQPISSYTDSFLLNNSNEARLSFELNSAGSYTISTKIENCRVEKKFNLEVTPCEVDIYIPNSFSPNSDGINDFAEPFGKDFSGLSLAIYNRWGGKIFETNTAPFAWDGNFDNQKANEGVYVMIFKYQNQRNGKEETISSDVLLLR